MTHISRTDPHACADLVLTKSEIGALCSLKRFTSKKFHPALLTVRQALIAIAALGGHLARRIPNIVILGDQEIATDSVTLRRYCVKDQITIPREKFVQRMIGLEKFRVMDNFPDVDPDLLLATHSVGGR